MRRTTLVLPAIACLLAIPVPRGRADDDEAQIRALTSEFCAAVVKGDLSVLDRIFDPGPSNVYFDINEGPLVGLDRLRRVWQAATRNARLTRFEFDKDLKVAIDGDRALQAGLWMQSQTQADGTPRDIAGRATILWRKTADGWRVYHYHASITPRRQR